MTEPARKREKEHKVASGVPVLRIRRQEEPAWSRVAVLFRPMSHHLAVEAVLSGTVPGAVYVHDVAHPRWALLQRGHRYFLVGDQKDEEATAALHALFARELYPMGQAEGATAFVFYYEPARWEPVLRTLLADKHPIVAQRAYYVWRGPMPAWRALLPAGVRVQKVERALVADSALDNVEDLRAEIVTESLSVDAFFDYRFGFCAVAGDTLAGWCLSEYNQEQRCEVGIETMAPFRRQGIATALAGALVEHALEQGIGEVGWHCYAGNAPSVATAEKAGFERRRDYPVHFARFDPVANLAVNGNVCLGREQYAEALAWYARAFAAGEPPVWAFVNAADAAAQIGAREEALGYLQQAVDRGFADVAYLQQASLLQSLHGLPGWVALLEEIIRQGG